MPAHGERYVDTVALNVVENHSDGDALVEAVKDGEALDEADTEDDALVDGDAEDDVLEDTEEDGDALKEAVALRDAEIDTVREGVSGESVELAELVTEGETLHDAEVEGDTLGVVVGVPTQTHSPSTSAPQERRQQRCGHGDCGVARVRGGRGW